MKKIDFNNGWTFKKDDKLPVSVTLPHDAMLYEKRSADAPGGTGCAFYPGGKYTYEKTFGFPAEAALLFEGVYRNATVYIDGAKAAFHAYGHTPFCVNVPNGTHTVTVEADNSQLPNSRWYSGSGIYRPVWLCVGKKVDIRVATLSDSSAVIKVEPKLPCEILDGDKVIASGTDEITIPNAKLWSDETPYLYTCRIGEDEVAFGIRKIEWSSKGLFVNGKSVKLRGGCVHHDNGILGACAYEEAEDRKVRILKEAGFNTIRSAHNPCSEAFIRACDKYGIYLIDEMWDMWYERKNKYDYALDFEANWQDDVAVTIARDYNHPSVIMYSIGNENLEPYNKKGLSTLNSIVDSFHSADSTRPVTMGFNPAITFGASKEQGLYRDDKAGGSMLFNIILGLLGEVVRKITKSKAVDKIVYPVIELLDIVGYNYANGRFDNDSKAYPDKLFYGSETMPYQISANWEKVKKNPYVCGDFFWTAWDYLGESGLGSWSYRSEAAGFNKKYPWKLAEAGAIDLLGNIGAEAVYGGFIWGTRTEPYIAVSPPNHPKEKLHKSYWRGTNAVSSWSWCGCDGNPTTVEVYAVGESVRLELNGRVVGKAKLKNWKTKIKIAYQPGTLKAVVLDKNGEIITETALTSATGELSVRVTPENDGTFYNVEIVGENGVVESNADRKLVIKVEGGELLGFGSAEPCTAERFVSGTYTTYMGRALSAVRITDSNKLRIEVTAV